jgi:chemotaxis protein CheD
MQSKSPIIDVAMAEMKTARNGEQLRSSGIGSCIVIALYDPKKKIGALAHPLISAQKKIETTKRKKKDGSTVSTPSMRYIEHAIDSMIGTLEKFGGTRRHFVAKIAGGAHMFQVFDKSEQSIGTRNVNAVKAKLEEQRVAIVGNDTGGNAGRTIVFDTKTGIVSITTQL